MIKLVNKKGLDKTSGGKIYLLKGISHDPTFDLGAVLCDNRKEAEAFFRFQKNYEDNNKIITTYEERKRLVDEFNRIYKGWFL